MFLSSQPLINRHLGLGQGVRPGVPRCQLQRAGIPQTLQQRKINRGDCRRLATVNADNLLPRFKSGSLRQGARHDRIDHRDDPRLSPEKEHPQDHNGQQKIGDGACGSDGHSLTHGLTVVGAGSVRLRDFVVSLIRHTDITTKRDGRNHVLGLILTLPPQQGPPETNGKSQHLDACAASHPKMAIFMNRHNNGEGRQGNEYRL